MRPASAFSDLSEMGPLPLTQCLLSIIHPVTYLLWYSYDRWGTSLSMKLLFLGLTCSQRAEHIEGALMQESAGWGNGW